MDFIEHYGIKGQRWGVRRYQNEDGSLTPAGRKRLSKDYKKLSVKVTKDLSKNYEKMNIDSYNEASKYMNETGLNKINSKKYKDQDSYFEAFEKEFNDKMGSILNKSLYDFYSSNKNYKKAKELVDKYDMTKWDDLAKSNENTIKELKKYLKNGE